ncbi:MAG: ATP-grasp domain-containing protein [Candidatus Cloacimonetes bacterium]|nr:ATP-grasp domain-containing protein [Candidatus Cloacimonadota bacterium]
MSTDKNIAILVGGTGMEAPISLSSGRFIYENFPRDYADPFIIYLHKDFTISVYNDYSFCQGQGTLLEYNGQGKRYSVGCIKEACLENGYASFDVLPMVHGLSCEDGKILHLFECLNIKYAGFDAKSSVLTFDKVLSKLVLQDKGYPVLDYQWFSKGDDLKRPFANQTIFIKPSRQGSSVGVQRVEPTDDFTQAMNDVFIHDNKVLIEPECIGREIECAVIEIGGEWRASSIGELTFNDSFYSYEAKYKSEESKASIVELSPHINTMIQTTAINVVKTLGGRGFARVDFFLENDKIYINEVNTLPGMTPISMFPVLLSQIGIAPKQMILHLIQEIS